MMPTILAMALAVIGWSPVTIITCMYVHVMDAGRWRRLWWHKIFIDVRALCVKTFTIMPTLCSSRVHFYNIIAPSTAYYTGSPPSTHTTPRPPHPPPPPQDPVPMDVHPLSVHYMFSYAIELCYKC
jgi:hypothetical protein